MPIFSSGGGSAINTIQSVTATGSASNWGSVITCTSATAITLTLPNAQLGVGRSIVVKNLGVGLVTVAGFSGNTLTGNTSVTQGQSVEFMSIGASNVTSVSDSTESQADPSTLLPWAASTAIQPLIQRSIAMAGTTISMVNIGGARTTAATFTPAEAAFWSILGQSAVGTFPATATILAGLQIIDSEQLYEAVLTRTTGATFAVDNIVANWLPLASSATGTRVNLSNFTANGAIGTAAATVDVATVLTFTQATPAITVTVPSPTNLTAHKTIVLENLSVSTQVVSVSLASGTVQLLPGQTREMQWNGSTWSLIGQSPVISDYCQLRAITGSYTTNVAVNEHFKFAVVNNSAGSGIIPDLTTPYNTGVGASLGRVTLKAGKTYSLRGCIGDFGSAPANVYAYIAYAWYNVTSSGYISTNQGFASNTRDNGSLPDYGNSSPLAEDIFTATVDTIVELRIKNISNVSSINGALNSTPGYAIIQSIAGQLPVEGFFTDHLIASGPGAPGIYAVANTNFNVGGGATTQSSAGGITFSNAGNLLTLSGFRLGVKYQVELNAGMYIAADAPAPNAVLIWRTSGAAIAGGAQMPFGAYSSANSGPYGGVQFGSMTFTPTVAADQTIQLHTFIVGSQSISFSNWYCKVSQVGASPLTRGDLVGEQSISVANSFLYPNTGLQNDVDFQGNSVVRVTGAALNLSGIKADANHKFLTLLNQGTTSFDIQNESASSVASNRVVTGRSAAVTIPAGASALMQYDVTAARWRLIGEYNVSGVTQVNTSTALTSWDNIVEIGATPLTSNITLTLPSVANNLGRKITFKRLDNTAFTVTVAAFAAQTVEITTPTLLNSQFGAYTIAAVSATKSEQISSIGSSSAGSPFDYTVTFDDTVVAGDALRIVNNTGTPRFRKLFQSVAPVATPHAGGSTPTGSNERLILQSPGNVNQYFYYDKLIGSTLFRLLPIQASGATTWVTGTAASLSNATVTIDASPAMGSINRNGTAGKIMYINPNGFPIRVLDFSVGSNTVTGLAVNNSILNVGNWAGVNQQLLSTSNPNNYFHVGETNTPDIKAVMWAGNTQQAAFQITTGISSFGRSVLTKHLDTALDKYLVFYITAGNGINCIPLSLNVSTGAVTSQTGVATAISTSSSAGVCLDYIGTDGTSSFYACLINSTTVRVLAVNRASSVVTVFANQTIPAVTLTFGDRISLIAENSSGNFYISYSQVGVANGFLVSRYSTNFSTGVVTVINSQAATGASFVHGSTTNIGIKTTASGNGGSFGASQFGTPLMAGFMADNASARPVIIGLGTSNPTVFSEYAGMAKSSIAAASSGAGVLRYGGRVTGLTGLTIGSLYYFDNSSGALTLTNTGNLIGRAISTTELQLA